MFFPIVNDVPLAYVLSYLIASIGKFSLLSDINNFSVYRKNFLNNEKVFLTWKNIIKPKMSNEGTFVKSIDTFYKDKKNDYC